MFPFARGNDSQSEVTACNLAVSEDLPSITAFLLLWDYLPSKHH